MNKGSDAIEKIAELCLEDEAYYENQENAFKSPEVLKNQDKQLIIDYLESHQLQDSLARAVSILLSQDSLQILSDEEATELEDNLFKMTEDKFLHPSPDVEKMMQENEGYVIPYQHIFGITGTALLIIYKIGHHYFQNHDFDKAIDIFTLLVTLNHTIPDFNSALGLCYQVKQQWEDAIIFFTITTFLDRDNVKDRLSLVECYLRLKNDQEARKYLEEISQIQKQHPEKVEPWLEIYQALENQK